ncbi:hypothetical protein GA0074696_3826 [Micromonospora purpureochromogenes]|uniref:Uncharacterized protein n=1 Tax=Micromonospora purpureochromogenes TaxID=47872 RepID=A0A1C4YY07_9ACTN|nr:hypothetical protein [Micromonospora purpureochromogenes]SCF25564.1 hypothetical protein GA0074696_3826 [Micromonospora purpureochromogenes]
MERYDELTRKYAALPNQGGVKDGFRYQPEAWRLFPRYHVVEAILVEIERLDPDLLPELAGLVDALVAAADGAHSPLTQPAGNEVEAEAMAAERRLFRSTVNGWLAGGDLRVEPLAYRRVLTPAEAAARQDQLRRWWGLVDRCWYPLLAEPIPPDVLVLAEAAMWDEQGIAHVRRELREMGGRRVMELREDGTDYLVDVDIVAPRYAGVEGVWSDDTLSWIAYASHEGTVTFGGHLAVALHTTWADLDRWRSSPD